MTAVCFGQRRARLKKDLSPPSLLDEGLDKVEDAYEEDKQRGHNETVSIADKGAAQHAQSAADGSSSNSNGSISSSSSDLNGVSMRMDFCTRLCSRLPNCHHLRVLAALPTQVHHARAGSTGLDVSNHAEPCGTSSHLTLHVVRAMSLPLRMVSSYQTQKWLAEWRPTWRAMLLGRRRTGWRLPKRASSTP